VSLTETFDGSLVKEEFTTAAAAASSSVVVVEHPLEKSIFTSIVPLNNRYRKRARERDREREMEWTCMTFFHAENDRQGERVFDTSLDRPSSTRAGLPTRTHCGWCRLSLRRCLLSFLREKCVPSCRRLFLRLGDTSIYSTDYRRIPIYLKKQSQHSSSHHASISTHDAPFSLRVTTFVAPSLTTVEILQRQMMASIHAVFSR
jgi:hypothetical protein